MAGSQRTQAKIIWLGNGSRVSVPETAARLLPELKKRGFRVVTCAQLFAEAGVTPVHGRLYSNVYQTVNKP